METITGRVLREIAKKNFGYLTTTYKSLVDAADKFDEAYETIETWIVSDKRYKELISLQAENDELKEKLKQQTDELYRLRAAAGSENRW